MKNWGYNRRSGAARKNGAPLPPVGRLLPLLLAFSLLPGCAPMLNREYISVEPHEQSSETRTESSALRAEDYTELVDAISYLVSQGDESGVIRLYNYTRDVDSDLNDACLEVTKEDPLAAYAVSYIKYEFSRIVYYYEAYIQITYRRTPEQIRSLVTVTDSSGILDELRKALRELSPEVVLRVSNLSGEEDYITRLVTEAYLDTPEAAAGLPDISVTLYPDSGYQRIVDILLTYSENTDALLEKQDQLSAASERCAAGLHAQKKDMPAAIFNYLRGSVRLQGSGIKTADTAYAALVEGKANNEGLALAFHLLCRLTGTESMVVQGTRGNQACFWNLVKTESGWRHVDVSWDFGLLLTDDSMKMAGYDWDADVYPACAET